MIKKAQERGARSIFCQEKEDLPVNVGDALKMFQCQCSKTIQSKPALILKSKSNGAVEGNSSIHKLLGKSV